MEASFASAGPLMVNTSSLAVKMTSFLSGLLPSPPSSLGVKGINHGSLLFALIHGAVMIGTIALAVLVMIAGFCCGILVLECCIVRRLYVRSRHCKGVILRFKNTDY